MIKEPELTQDKLIEMYQQMRLIRRFEEAAAEWYARGRIAGFLPLYIGEEAIAVGAIAALRRDDHIITHYRDHGHALARGMDPKAVMAELFGKATGVSGGRGGSMHLAEVDKYFWGGYAIVSGHLPLATGLALAEQYQGTDRIVACIFHHSTPGGRPGHRQRQAHTRRARRRDLDHRSHEADHLRRPPRHRRRRGSPLPG